MARTVYTWQDRTILCDGVPVLTWTVPRKPDDQGGGFYHAPHLTDALGRHIVALLNRMGGQS